MYNLIDKTDIEFKERLYNRSYSKWFLLQEAKRQKRKCLVFITPIRYSQTERYRVEHIIEAIENINEWYAIALSYWELHILYRYMDCVSVIVLERLQWNDNLERCLNICHAHSIAVIYEVDDLVTNVDKLDIVINSIESDKAGMRKEIELNNKLAEQCDALWTTNEYLANCLESQYHKPVFVTKNFMNREQQIVAESLLVQKIEGKVSTSPFMIGYFSGSMTHNIDFQMVANAIIKFMNEHEDTSLEIVGYLNLPNEFMRFKHSGRLIQLSYMKPCELEKEIAKVNVNIIPLCVNEFTNCKSEIKYFEAAMAGTPSIMSPTFVYNRIKEINGPGIICNNEYGWYFALKELYSYKDNTERNKNNMKKYHEFAWKYYSCDNQAPALNNTLDKMIDLNG